jgi:hypothetical protein
MNVRVGQQIRVIDRHSEFHGRYGRVVEQLPADPGKTVDAVQVNFPDGSGSTFTLADVEVHFSGWLRGTWPRRSGTGGT